MSMRKIATANYGDSEPIARNDLRGMEDLERGDEGFMLIAAIVMIFMVLLVLSIAAPRVAREIQRDREQESARRAEQYVRAIRIFYLRFKRYPTSLEQLEKTNNQRFLRQRYVDPLTGKDDWRLIHVGENLTQVKGFFGDDLPGLPSMTGGGLGSASSLASTTGGGGAPASTSAFSNNSPGTSAFGNNGSTTSPLGGTSGASGASAAGQTGTGAASTSGTSTGSPGVASQNATDFIGSGGGPIMGIGSTKSGEAMLVVNEQATYDTWEFLYDPRIEQLYAKGNLLGGISSGSGTSGGFGTPIGTTPATGTGIGGTGTGGTGTGGTGAGPTGTPPAVGVPILP